MKLIYSLHFSYGIVVFLAVCLCQFTHQGILGCVSLVEPENQNWCRFLPQSFPKKTRVERGFPGNCFHRLWNLLKKGIVLSWWEDCCPSESKTSFFTGVVEDMEDMRPQASLTLERSKHLPPVFWESFQDTHLQNSLGVGLRGWQVPCVLQTDLGSVCSQESETNMSRCKRSRGDPTSSTFIFSQVTMHEESKEQRMAPRAPAVSFVF